MKKGTGEAINLQLKKFNIDPKITEILVSHGIKELFPPQAEALELGLLNSNTNQVIATNTATGKTLLAELVMIQSILNKNGKCIYVTPLKAIAEEKHEDFIIKYGGIKKNDGTKLNIGIFTGDYTTGFYDQKVQGNEYDLMIMTPEKLDSIIRKHRTNEWIQDVTVLVIDEFHLLGDEGRGPRLEACIVRMKELNPLVRIIGLSATISNIDEMADWLKATDYSSDWRPVPLEKKIIVPQKSKIETITEEVLSTIREGGQCIVFVNSRKKAEKMALSLSEKIWVVLKQEVKDSLQKTAEKIYGETTIEKLLYNFIKKGVSFHHAGMTREQRTIVESSFKHNLLKCICSTPTLAMGVNLPARKVIISDLTKPGNGRAVPVTALDVFQISGRAGRPGMDKKGECSIIGSIRDNELALQEKYIDGGVEPVESRLLEPKRLLEQILAEFTSGLSKTENDLIHGFFDKTFAFHKNAVDPITIYNGIDLLVNNQLLRPEEEKKYHPTFLGKITSQLYVAPESAIIMRQFLLALENFSLMDILFMLSSLPDLEPKVWIRGDEVDFLVDKAQSIDFNLTNYSFDAVANTILADTAKPEMTVLESLKRALILFEWISGEKESIICENYRVYPDDLFKLRSNAEWMAHALTSIANTIYVDEKPRTDVRDLAKQLVLRIHYGATPELLQLVQIPEIGRKRAMALYEAGIKSRKDIQKATTTQLIKKGGLGKKLALRVKQFVEADIKRSKEATLEKFMSLADKIDLMRKLSKELGNHFFSDDLVDLCLREGLEDPNYHVKRLMENRELLELPDGRLQWRVPP